MLTFAFLQQFADFLLFALQVVSQVVVLLLRLIDQLVEVCRLFLDLTGFILKTQRLVNSPGSQNIHDENHRRTLGDMYPDYEHHLQSLGVQRRDAGQVGEDLHSFVPGIFCFCLNLIGLLLQILCQLLGLVVPER